MPATHEQLDLAFGHPADRVSVRQSSRAKRLSLKADAINGVEVVVPKRASAKQVAAFVKRNQAWIDTQKAYFASRSPENTSLPRELLFQALDQRVSIMTGVQQSTSYKHTSGLLTIKSTQHKKVVNALKDFVREQAKLVFAPELKRLSDVTGLSYKRMRVGLQKTLWGSYSSSGTLSLNAALLFLPTSVMHYVMIHELCHIQHPNHSRDFWRLVLSFDKHAMRHERALDQHWKSIPRCLFE